MVKPCCCLGQNSCTVKVYGEENGRFLEECNSLRNHLCLRDGV